MAMVGNVTSLTNNGLRDWLIQRITAVVLAVFSIFIMGYLIMHPQLEYAQWYSLFQPLWMRIFTLLALASLLLHAWIGIWTVTTDYLKSAVLRLFVQMLVLMTLLCCVVWGIVILW